jgi:bacterioferritin
MPAVKNSINKKKVIDQLNSILELELAGVVRYTHYSFMIFGPARIPVIKWMREQAEESMLHATEAGEHVTGLGGHPSLKIGKLLETQKHKIEQILREALTHEREALASYYQLLAEVQDRSVYLEEYARKMIHEEENHILQVEKMLRGPGRRARGR